MTITVILKDKDNLESYNLESKQVYRFVYDYDKRPRKKPTEQKPEPVFTEPLNKNNAAAYIESKVDIYRFHYDTKVDEYLKSTECYNLISKQLPVGIAAPMLVPSAGFTSAALIFSVEMLHADHIFFELSSINKSQNASLDLLQHQQTQRIYQNDSSILQNIRGY